MTGPSFQTSRKRNVFQIINRIINELPKNMDHYQELSSKLNTMIVNRSYQAPETVLAYINQCWINISVLLTEYLEPQEIQFPKECEKISNILRQKDEREDDYI
jgi:hypothetical protein